MVTIWVLSAFCAALTIMLIGVIYYTVRMDRAKTVLFEAVIAQSLDQVTQRADARDTIIGKLNELRAEHARYVGMVKGCSSNALHSAYMNSMIDKIDILQDVILTYYRILRQLGFGDYTVRYYDRDGNIQATTLDDYVENILGGPKKTEFTLISSIDETAVEQSRSDRPDLTLIK